mmetsp:Transcript_40860/g.89404  ORF Transcript_40860/g.89404 Transcript_40860/m.89404 type:complete len:224 (-) Transcript_40860:409-1080(-)
MATTLRQGPLSGDTLQGVIVQILNAATETPRNFVETIELQIGLQDYDSRRDKRFAGTIRLPHVPKPRMTVCVLGDDLHCEQAHRLGVPCRSMAELKAMSRDKKALQRFRKSFDGMLCSDSLIKYMPRLLAPPLGRAGKFPKMIRHSDCLEEKVRELRSEIKFQLKKVLCMGVAVGNVGMTPQQLRQNCLVAIKFLVSLLKKGWKNVKRLHLKSTMGRPFTIYG